MPTTAEPDLCGAALAAVQDGDTVSFASSLNGTPIVLTSGEIDTAKSYTIAGNGANQTIIDGNHASRVLAVIAGAVTISGVTVRNGNVALVGVNTSSAAGLLVEGGASLLVTTARSPETP